MCHVDGQVLFLPPLGESDRLDPLPFQMLPSIGVSIGNVRRTLSESDIETTIRGCEGRHVDTTRAEIAHVIGGHGDIEARAAVVQK